jgi:hypothetical protein
MLERDWRDRDACGTEGERERDWRDRDARERLERQGTALTFDALHRKMISTGKSVRRVKSRVDANGGYVCH